MSARAARRTLARSSAPGGLALLLGARQVGAGEGVTCPRVMAVFTGPEGRLSRGRQAVTGVWGRAFAAAPGGQGSSSVWCRVVAEAPQRLGCPLQVILACNSGPALNDVTYSESLIVAERIAAMDPVVQ